MKRLLLDPLLAWKAKPFRKPLLLDGARQTGKTYLLQNLLGSRFSKVLRVDFLESPGMMDAFTDSLNPATVLNNLQLMSGEVFHPQTDLLILDEIGECPRAVASLKYFAEKTPEVYVAASGSNIGLLDAFPIGKVEAHHLKPLNFREFLMASAESSLLEAFEQQVDSTTAHQMLFDKLTDYYFTGGMPEAVSCWFENQQTSILSRIQAVEQIQGDLISGYSRDFGKYHDKVNANLIEAVFQSVPTQLSRVQDESSRRFQFKGVFPRKSRYHELESAINWLDKTGLVLKNYLISGKPRFPLAAQRQDNLVKLFLFDVGLLNHLLQPGYAQIKKQAYAYKGYVAENFVQQEFAAQGMLPTYCWSDARAEIEFICSDDAGNIIPIEVKRGKRTRTKSLCSYITKCSPRKTIKLTGTRGSAPTEQQHLVLPLYYCEYVIQRHLNV